MDTQIPTIGLNQAQTDSLDLGNQAQNSSSGAELALFPVDPISHTNPPTRESFFSELQDVSKKVHHKESSNISLQYKELG